MVTRLVSLAGNDGAGDPAYGGQLDYQAIRGHQREGSMDITYEHVEGNFADNTSYSLARPVYSFRNLSDGKFDTDTRFSTRVAPVIFGLGLLEAIPEQVILAVADPDDRNHDGISGRPNIATDRRTGQKVLGRFGWKAGQPSLEQQIARALQMDMGLTTDLYRHEDHSPEFTSGSRDPEISPEIFQKMLFYMKLLAVPKRRDWLQPQVLRGKQIFRTLGCGGCHLSTPVTTGSVAGYPELSAQVIYPYTDLLLHDMGADLADDCPEGAAGGGEWRTPPLWGIGLVSNVNGHTRFLHDGRARSIEEAILWHGGEAGAAQEAYRRLKREDRASLLVFLNSL